MIGVDPKTGRVLVPDLGLDAVLSYQVGEAGELSERAAERIITRPGAGPRHLAFHPDGQHLFLLNEIDSTLMALRRDGTRFIQTDLTSTLPESCTDHSEAAAVRVSATGRHVFVSNRGFDSIAMFRLDPASGKLTLEHVEPTRGGEPRDICQTPDGEYLLVANQDTHSIVSFAIDEDEPTLRAGVGDACAESRLSRLRTLSTSDRRVVRRARGPGQRTSVNSLRSSCTRLA